MRTSKFRRSGGRRHESGQVMLFVLLGLGIFLLGAMAFAIDLSNLWFNRQAAQTAADAACTAGAMDLLIDDTNGGTNGGFTPGTAFDCNTNSGYAACKYAALNGFDSSIAQGSTALGNNVYVDFPSPGNPPPGITAPPLVVAANPFLRVTITNNIPTFFAGMLKGLATQSVKAYAVCGVQLAKAPIPILVLHPTFAQSLSVQGSPTINVVGGATQSIQVNSCSTSNNAGSGCGTNDAANMGGSATVNLCAAGNNFCGGNLGVFGTEASQSGFVTSCTGNRPAGAPSCSGTQVTPQWNSPESPISDPFAQVSAPANPDPTSSSTPYVPTDLCGPDGLYITTKACTCSGGTGTQCTNSSNGANPPGHCTSSDIAGGNCYVDYKVHGCPDSSAPIVPNAPTSNSSCVLYTPGYYPTGIQAKNGVSVFDPGLYWLDPITSGADKGYDLALDSNSFVRPSLYPGTYSSPSGPVTVPSWFGYNDGTNWDGGTIFYFHGTGSVHVDSNSGKVSNGSGKGSTAPDSLGNTAWQSGGATLPTLVTCPNGGTAPSVTLPNSIGGNILMAPCSLTGTWSDPGTTGNYAKFRGILFFQDRGNAGTAKNPVTGSWGGGGQFLLAGTIYLHQCIESAADTGTGCAANTPVPFNVQFTLSGNASNGTYVLGEIVTDQLSLGGSSAINMQLNPNSSFNILKVALLQ